MINSVEIPAVRFHDIIMNKTECREIIGVTATRRSTHLENLSILPCWTIGSKWCGLSPAPRRVGPAPWRRSGSRAGARAGAVRVRQRRWAAMDAHPDSTSSSSSSQLTFGVDRILSGAFPSVRRPPLHHSGEARIRIWNLWLTEFTWTNIRTHMPTFLKSTSYLVWKRLVPSSFPALF